MGNVGREKIAKLLEVLIDEPRISIRKISEKTGLSYASIRRRLKSMNSRNILSFSVLISADLMGRDVAIVRFKTSKLDHLLNLALHCNKVLVGARINSEEALMVINGESKQEIASTVDKIRSSVDDLREISVEYGKLPARFMVRVKNKNLNCNPQLSCNNCAQINSSYYS
ncbi:MAG: winged helix-turn-helix transcriptional regulator [Desulfurococcaceae archaeon]